MQSRCHGNVSSWIRPLLLASLMTAPAVHAEEQPTLTGDWGGRRTTLADEGVILGGNYQAQAGHNYSGGDRQLTRYTDQWAFVGMFDLQKLWGWDGAEFQVIVTNRNGRNLNIDANIPVYDQVQAIWGRGQTWWLTMFALHQKLFDDRVELRIGRLTPEEDFDTSSCDFMNITFCGGPPGNLAGGTYWINWPASQWAAVVTFNFADTTYFKVGGYQLNSTYLDTRWQRANAWKPNFPGGTKGALMPAEFGWKPEFNGLKGSYMVGAWYQNSGGNDVYFNTQGQPLGLFGGSPMQRHGSYGGYLAAIQKVTNDSHHGITLTFNAAAADRNTAYIDRQFTFMTEYHSPFGRPQDFIGVGIGATRGNPRYAAYERQVNLMNPNSPIFVAAGYEYESEIFYNWSPAPGVNLRPNFQYLVHPGGSSKAADAAILGLNALINF